MRVGSLVERVSDGELIEQGTNRIVEGMPGFVPKKVPLVISAWKFCDRNEHDLYKFQIDGYEFVKNNGVTTEVWYSPKLFVELQPPMDLTFVEEMQVSSPKIKYHETILN